MSANEERSTIRFEKDYSFVFDQPSKFHSDFRNLFLDKIKNLKKDEPDVFYEDDKVVVIYDRFPKAMYHLLILPRDTSLLYLSSLSREHIPLIQHMMFVGQQIVNYLMKKSKTHIEFKMGFHAIPSIKLIHLHVISQDFISKFLKRRHWNSFNTKFFIPPEQVIRELKEKGKIHINEEEYKKINESKEMKCVRTGKTFTDMRSLKSHLYELYNEQT